MIPFRSLAGKPVPFYSCQRMLAERKNGYYRKLLEQMSPADLSDEVRSTLDALRGRGCAFAIGSSSKNTKFILKQIGLEGYFDAVSDGANITRSKPDPQVLQMAAEFLSLSPEDCLAVEDAPVGIDAAKAGGFAAAASSAHALSSSCVMVPFMSRA